MFSKSIQDRETPMIIGVPKEIHPGERRVAMVPSTIGQMKKLGYEVIIEKGAGILANFPDNLYQDAGADLILFRRQDGAFLGSVDIAINKAVSAVMIPYPTRVIGDLAYGKDGNPGRVPGISTVDFLVPFAGGLPIRTESGHLIGAIGISGASSDQDEECAQAAIDAVQDYLK